MTAAIEPETGAIIGETTLPVFVATMTDDGGLHALSITIDLASLGGERWTYDSVIAAEDGKVTVLFFDEDD